MAQAVAQLKQAIAENEIKTMAKLADLAAALNALETKLETIDAAVKVLVATTTNVDLPADAQAALDKLSAEVDTLGADATPAKSA